jgi:hypothetical protein
MASFTVRDDDPRLVELEFRQDFTPEELVQYRHTFVKYDDNKSGALETFELNVMFEEWGQPKTALQLRQLIAEANTSNTGAINYREFLNVILKDKKGTAKGPWTGFAVAVGKVRGQSAIAATCNAFPDRSLLAFVVVVVVGARRCTMTRRRWARRPTSSSRRSPSRRATLSRKRSDASRRRRSARPKRSASARSEWLQVLPSSRPTSTADRPVPPPRLAHSHVHTHTRTGDAMMTKPQTAAFTKVVCGDGVSKRGGLITAGRRQARRRSERGAWPPWPKKTRRRCRWYR